jgi:L-2,4-diaminobutyrate transaminase
MLHPFTAPRSHETTEPFLIGAGKGTTLTDLQGRRYLDAMAGLWCVNVGYGRDELADALAGAARRLGYYHAFSSAGTEAPARLAGKLVEVAPVPVSKVFFGNSGSDANDTQVKLVWYYNNVLGRPAKKKIISRRRGYHGVTVMSGGLTGLDNLHAGFDLPLPMIRHVRPPHRLWEREEGMSDIEFAQVLADELDQTIRAEGPDTVAAFIAEPVQAAGGVIVPPETYFPAIQRVLDEHDVLLIADEVVCAFGRLGTWFGSEVVGAKPDLITVAKGLTSAYFPLSACLVSTRVWEVIREAEDHYGVLGHGYTYSAHPVGAEVALANLSIIVEEGLMDAAVRQGERLRASLRRELGDHPYVAEVRGAGLMAAVELAPPGNPREPFDPAARIGPRIAAAARNLGVITRALPAADTLAMSPPLVVTDEEIDEIVETIRQAVVHVTDDVDLSIH